MKLLRSIKCLRQSDLNQVAISALLVGAVFIGFFVVMGTAVRMSFHMQGLEIPSFLAYRADRPFAFRVLVPATVNLLSSFSPHWVKSKVALSLSEQPADSIFYVPLHLRPPGYEFEGFLILAISAFALGTYLIVLLKIGLIKARGSIGGALIFPLLGVFSLEPFLFPRYYSYDFVTLALWSGCYYAIFRRSMLLYMTLFLCVSLNKETSGLLLIYYVLCRPLFVDRIKLWSTLLGAQVVIFGLIYYCLRSFFEINHGFLIQDHLKENIMTQMFAGYSLETFTMFVTLVGLILFRWRSKDLSFKAAMALFPILYGLYRYGGCCIEWRVFYEIVPAIVVLVATSFVFLLEDDSARSVRQLRGAIEKL